MRILRILLLPIFAAFLAGCAATTPLPQAQENVATTIDEPDDTVAAEVTSETEKPKPPAPKPAAASKTSRKAAKDLTTTPKVGSPEWKKERAEDERKERQLKQVIEGICSGC